MKKSIVFFVLFLISLGSSAQSRSEKQKIIQIEKMGSKFDEFFQLFASNKEVDAEVFTTNIPWSDVGIGKRCARVLESDSILVKKREICSDILFLFFHVENAEMVHRSTYRNGLLVSQIITPRVKVRRSSEESWRTYLEMINILDKDFWVKALKTDIKDLEILYAQLYEQLENDPDQDSNPAMESINKIKN